MKKRLSTKQKRKLTMELVMMVVALVGIIILGCNLFKTVPENNEFLSLIIAYGFLSGPAMITIGFCGFLEVRATKLSKFSKRAR